MFLSTFAKLPTFSSSTLSTLGVMIWCSGKETEILHRLLTVTIRLVGDRLVSRGHSVTQIRYAGTNMKYDFETNVTVRTLSINTTGFPCRYINQRGEFDFQSRDIKLVRLKDQGS